MRRILLQLSESAGINAGIRAMTRTGFRILAYHGVDDRDEPTLNADGFHVHPKAFKKQVEWIARRFNVIGLGEAVAARRKFGAWPAQSAAITFDDGYENNLRHAVPILERAGLPATFFITTGFVDNTHRPWWYRVRTALASEQDIPSVEARLKDLTEDERERAVQEIESKAARRPAAVLQGYPFMSPAGVAELSRRGFEIGAHTVSHVSFGQETRARRITELNDAAARLQQMTGRKPDLFAYPYGRIADLGPEDEPLFIEAGYQAAVTTVEGLNRTDDSLYQLCRFNITGRHGMNAFAARVSGLGLSLDRLFHHRR